MSLTKDELNNHSLQASPTVNPVLTWDQLKNLGIQLVKKGKAAELLDISPETLKKYRLQKGSTLIAGIHYVVLNSRTIRYNASLLIDWFLNWNAPEQHQKTIAAFLASLPANQPVKRGRRKA